MADLTESLRASEAFGGAGKSTGFDYKITSGTVPALIVRLDPNTKFFAEGGALVSMHSHISLTLGFGNGARQGVFGKLWSAVRRKMSGEGFLTQQFTNATAQKLSLTLAAPHPGDILPVPLPDFGGSILCQRGAFMAGPAGTELTIQLRQKVGFALFGKEHFVMQKVRGDNTVFLAAGGSLITSEVPPGQAVDVDTGCLVAMTSNISAGIVKAGSWMSTLFGTEGFFMVRCANQSADAGRVWIQTAPFSREVAAITAEQARQKGKTPSAVRAEPG